MKSKKSFLIKSDIDTIDKRYPDEEVFYTYIGMLAMDEDFPLDIYFNDSIGDSTITESLNTFNLDKYKDRITNLDELIKDIKDVENAGINNVMRIKPNEKLELHREAFNLKAYGENTGNWAIYKNKLYAERGGKLHSLWFEDIGLPSYGEEFDQVPRGWYKIDGGDLELVVYNEGYPQHVDTLFRNEDRIVEKAKQLEGIDNFEDIQLYEVSGSAKRRVANYQNQKKSNLEMVTSMEKAGHISWHDAQIQYINGTFTIEAAGKRTVLDEYEFTEYMQRQGEHCTDIKDVIDTLKEDYKSAALRKYAANDYLRFVSNIHAYIYIDELDLAIKPGVEDIKNSTLSLDEKVVAVKKLALAEATEKLEELNGAIPGISVSLDSLEPDMDNMNWDEFLTDED